MKYYKNKNNDIYAYDENTPKDFLASKIKELGLVKITEDEAKTILNPPLTAEQIRERELSKINNEYENAIRELTADVPDSEKGTWLKQEQEARAFLADNTVNTPLIDALCDARGVDKGLLATKIVSKADIYAQAIGTLTGIRQAKEDKL